MSRIGEVYELTATAPKRYFQFVALDETQLTSDVIAIFNTKKELKSYTQTDVEQVANSGVEFYAHTIVSAGVKEKLWKK